MAKKADAEQALKMFMMELGVPEELTVYGFKKNPGNEFLNRHFCLMYNFLNLIFSPHPLFYLAKGKTMIPMVMAEIIISN